MKKPATLASSGPDRERSRLGEALERVADHAERASMEGTDVVFVIRIDAQIANRDADGGPPRLPEGPSSVIDRVCLDLSATRRDRLDAFFTDVLEHRVEARTVKTYVLEEVNGMAKNRGINRRGSEKARRDDTLRRKGQRKPADRGGRNLRAKGSEEHSRTRKGRGFW